MPYRLKWGGGRRVSVGSRQDFGDDTFSKGGKQQRKVCSVDCFWGVVIAILGRILSGRRPWYSCKVGTEYVGGGRGSETSARMIYMSRTPHGWAEMLCACRTRSKRVAGPGFKCSHCFKPAEASRGQAEHSFVSAEGGNLAMLIGGTRLGITRHNGSMYF